MRTAAIELDEGQARAWDQVSARVQELEASLAMRCPQGRARSLALTKLDECAMWALRAVSEGDGR